MENIQKIGSYATYNNDGLYDSLFDKSIAPVSSFI
jgi:hypothetical protein